MRVGRICHFSLAWIRRCLPEWQVIVAVLVKCLDPGSVAMKAIYDELQVCI